jgi:ParB-like chromosome segregation protein Spo0J
MLPTLTIKNITLLQVDFNDFSYSINPKPDNEADETLKRSIERYGLLHPPLVMETVSGPYVIISGRKRLNVLRSLNREETCCLVIPPGFPENELFQMLLEEAQLVRQLTLAEKAIFLQKLAPLVAEEQIIREFLPRLGLAPDLFALKQILKLLDLENPILLGLYRGEVAEAIAPDLVSLSVMDRSILFEIIIALKLSFSNQKKLLHICRELADRENISIAALLDNSEVQAILHHQDANPPQKIKKLMIWLSERYRPRFTAAEKDFSHFITAIRLPKNVSVTHTPFFEDDAVTLAITFRNRKSLQNAWEKIKHATSDTDN